MHKQYCMLLLLSMASIGAMDDELSKLIVDQEVPIKAELTELTVDQEALIKVDDKSFFFVASYWQWNKQNAKFDKVSSQKNSKVQELMFDGEFSQDVITPDNQMWYCWNPRKQEDKKDFGVSWWKRTMRQLLMNKNGQS